MLTQNFFFQADVYSAERKTYKAKEINIRGRVCVISKVQQTRREKKRFFRLRFCHRTDRFYIHLFRKNFSPLSVLTLESVSFELYQSSPL